MDFVEVDRVATGILRIECQMFYIYIYIYIYTHTHIIIIYRCTENIFIYDYISIRHTTINKNVTDGLQIYF